MKQGQARKLRLGDRVTDWNMRDDMKTVVLHKGMDLLDCEEHLHDFDEDLNDDEVRARKKLIQVCDRIARECAE